MSQPAQKSPSPADAARAATWDPARAARAMANASDLFITLDARGTITDFVCLSDELARELSTVTGGADWLGRVWTDLVSSDSDDKASRLLAASGVLDTHDAPLRREINHPLPSGETLPIRYAATQVSDDGSVVLSGQDIRPIARLQQRLMSAQIALEREFLDLRAGETKYRLLAHMIDAPLLVVDTANLALLEANGSAQARLAFEKQLDGQPHLAELVAAEVASQLSNLIDQAKANGQSASGNIISAGESLPVYISLFRQMRRGCAMVLLAGQTHPAQEAADREHTATLRIMEANPDAFVVIDQHRRVITANAAFIELVQVGSKQRAMGSVVDLWFERPTVDYSILMATLREHRVVRRFATVIRGDLGSLENVEISAVLVQEDSDAGPLYGLSMRRVNIAVMNETPDRTELPRTTDQITGLVGHMPLKDIVKETTGLIEQICIETALKLTGDNRASAAQMLGLSRQSLYAKLGKIEEEAEGSGFTSDDRPARIKTRQDNVR